MAAYNINVGVNSYQAARGITQIRASLGQLNNTADRSRNLLSTLFVLPLLGIYTLQSALTNVVTVLADFSRSMAEVRAITGSTALQTRQLEQEFVRLGRTTRFTASEAARAGVQLARAGFDTTQITGVAEATLQLALATATDTSRAADIATNVLTAFNLTVEETVDVFDALTFTTARTNTDLLSLSEALKFIAPAAESANIPLNQIVASLGILAQAGLKGSIAGTGLRRVISKISAESPVVRKRLTEVGLTFEELNIQGGDLIGVLIKLIESGVDLGGAFQLFGDRGGPAFEAVASRLPEVERLAREISNAAGFTEQLAKIMGDNLYDAMVRVGSAVEAVILGIGRIGFEQGLINFLNSLTIRIRAVAADVGILVDILQSIGVLLGGAIFVVVIKTLISITIALTGINVIIKSSVALITSLIAVLINIRAPAIALAGVLTAVIGIFSSIIRVVKIFALIAIPLFIGFADTINVVNSHVTTLQDFLLSLGLSIVKAIVPGLDQVENLRDAFGLIVDNIITFVASEGFLRNVVKVVDLLIRSILGAVEAFKLLFSPALFEAFANAFSSYIEGLTARLITIPLLEMENNIRNIRPLGGTESRDQERERILRQEAIRSLTVGANVDFIDAYATSLDKDPRFKRLAEILEKPLITFEDVLEDATNSATSRISEFTEMQNRIASQRPSERLPITLEINKQPQSVIDERVFRRYLQSQREEYELLGLTNEQRKVRQLILDAEKDTQLDLNETQKEELVTLISGIQVRNSLIEQSRQLTEANELLILNSVERERQTRLLTIQADLFRKLTDVEKQDLLVIIDSNIALERQALLMDSVNDTFLEAETRIADLTELRYKGLINFREYNRELLKANAEIATLRLSTEQLTVAERLRLHNVVALSKATSRQNAIVDGLITEKFNLSVKVNDLNILYRQGAISLRVYREELLKTYTLILEARNIQDEAGDPSNILGIELTSDVLAGIKLGIIDFANTVNDTISFVRNATTNAFKSMEDALVSFVTTGKLEFSSLVDSIVADLVRLSIRQQITGPLFSAITTAFTVSAGATPAGASGGLVRGPGSGTSDSINARISNGEFVVNAASTRAYLPLLQAINKFGGSVSSGNNDGGVSIEIIDQRSNSEAPPVEIENRGRQADGRVAIRATIRDTTKEIVNSGELDSVMAQRYGVRPSLR